VNGPRTPAREHSVRPHVPTADQKGDAMRRTCVAIAVCAFLMLSVGAVGSGAGDRAFTALTKRVSKLEKEAAAQKTTIANLEKTLSELRKGATAAGKKLQAAQDRCDARTLLLAEWMDEHHPHKDRSRYHRDEIARRK